MNVFSIINENIGKQINDLKTQLKERIKSIKGTENSPSNYEQSILNENQNLIH